MRNNGVDGFPELGLDKVLEIAQQRGAHPAQVALAWQLSRPFITAPIVGANTVQQLQDLLPAAQLQLSAEEVAALNEVSSWPLSRTEREI